MTQHEKLQRLSRMSELVLYKWVAGHIRVAGDFIMLSDLRLNVLTCDGGTIVYSSAAPVLLQDKGRPVIQFKDHDVMTVLNGPRKGINVLSSLQKDGEEATEARFCDSRVVDEDHCPKWLESKILSMGNSPTYPVAQLRLPEQFRISKKPDTLKPIFSSQLIKDIGGQRGDSTAVLLDKFHNNMDLFGYYTDDGFIISFDYIATGGCCVIASKGISVKTGSVVHMMTLAGFIAECERRRWSITTTNDVKGDKADEIQRVDRKVVK